MTRPAARFAVITLLLALVAVVAKAPSSSDWDIYQTIGRQLVVLDCHDVHCFRVLVAPIVERLPGPSLVNWKLYAVVTSAAAALAVGQLCLVLGLSMRAAGIATWIAAFGSGPLQSVLDPYTSDPVMYLLGPLMMADLLRGRVGRAGTIGSIGVLAKEFAAAPLWIFALFNALQRRWREAARAACAAATATLVWFALQTGLMALYNYSYGGNPSANLLGGGWLARWLSDLGALRAVSAVLLTFGPLLVAFAVGLPRANRTMRLIAVSAIPAAAAFVYVQQPDRALWNFAFVVIPVAALVLQELPNRLVLLFVVTFAITNVRLGTRTSDWFVWMRLTTLVVSTGLVVVAARLFWSTHGSTTANGVAQPFPKAAIAGLQLCATSTLAVIFTLEILAFGWLSCVHVDRRMHQRDAALGFNQWGYRDEARGSKVPRETRVAILGGSAAFEAGTNYSRTFAGQLFFELRDAGAPFKREYSVVNLAEPRVGAASYAQTLRDYRFLEPDIVLLFDGYDGGAELPPHARRRSIAYRATGYLPVLPARLFGGVGWLSDPDLGVDASLRDQGEAADDSCAAASAAYCQAMAAAVRSGLQDGRIVIVLSPPTVSKRHAVQQQSLTDALTGAFGADRRFLHLDLGSAVDLSTRTSSPASLRRTDGDNHELAQRVARFILGQFPPR